MRIAVFTDTYHPQVNGLVTSIDSNRVELARLGHSLKIFAPQLKGSLPEPEVLRLHGLVYPPQPEYTFVLPWGKGFDLRHEGGRDVDLVHCHGSWGAALVARAMARRWKKPMVMTYHTFWPLYVHYSLLGRIGVPASLQLKFLSALNRWLAKACKVVIAPTKVIRRQLLLDGVATPVEVLPTGLTGDVYSRQPARGKKMRKKLGLAAGDFLIASAGRLGPEKNWELLVKAFASRRELKKARLVIAGDGPDREKLKGLAVRLGLGSRLLLTGYLDRAEVLDLFEAADLFAFASVTETQGMVVLEAMARACAVVCVDALGPGEMLKGGQAGWLCREDVASLGRGLAAAITRPEVRRRKARKALALARQYDAGRIHRRLVRLYHRVVREGA